LKEEFSKLIESYMKEKKFINIKKKDCNDYNLKISKLLKNEPFVKEYRINVLFLFLPQFD